MQEYVEFSGGNRPIKKVLIANNGNAAIKGNQTALSLV
jgi:hypothetical protein